MTEGCTRIGRCGGVGVSLLRQIIRLQQNTKVRCRSPFKVALRTATCTLTRAAVIGAAVRAGGGSGG
jgi:hypothetical protein